MGESVIGDNSWEAEAYGGRGKNGWDGGPIQQNVHQVFFNEHVFYKIFDMTKYRFR